MLERRYSVKRTIGTHLGKRDITIEILGPSEKHEIGLIVFRGLKIPQGPHGFPMSLFSEV